MTGKRRKARILAMKVLYVHELVDDNPADIIDEIAVIEEIDDESIKEYAMNIIRKVMLNMDNLNNIIENSTKNWTIKRMAVVDRNILRIALAEIFFQESVPDIVAIDEAIEIAKEYSTEDSGGFVNGILDSVVKKKDEFLKELV